MALPSTPLALRKPTLLREVEVNGQRGVHEVHRPNGITDDLGGGKPCKRTSGIFVPREVREDAYVGSGSSERMGDKATVAQWEENIPRIAATRRSEVAPGGGAVEIDLALPHWRIVCLPRDRPLRGAASHRETGPRVRLSIPVDPSDSACSVHSVSSAASVHPAQSVHSVHSNDPLHTTEAHHNTIDGMETRRRRSFFRVSSGGTSSGGRGLGLGLGLGGSGERVIHYGLKFGTSQVRMRGPDERTWFSIPGKILHGRVKLADTHGGGCRVHSAGAAAMLPAVYEPMRLLPTVSVDSVLRLGRIGNDANTMQLVRLKRRTRRPDSVRLAGAIAGASASYLDEVENIPPTSAPPPTHTQVAPHSTRVNIVARCGGNPNGFNIAPYATT